jgi:hypothetical protein
MLYAKMIALSKAQLLDNATVLMTTSKWGQVKRTIEITISKGGGKKGLHETTMTFINHMSTTDDSVCCVILTDSNPDITLTLHD